MLQPSLYEAVLHTALSENVCVDYEAWLRREKAQARLARSCACERTRTEG